ncbi:uncharacterized protein LOC123869012 [Maniola jurtina]|uniref:uncharacterized protein LOC123869012 n=1 Tax=Maniola jurtina TaxID=191418 RepID=UPI001E68DC51|nr:uncharacterized protein LOC123869012 [Maniola jurtina]
MYTHSIFFIAAIICCAQCIPLDASHSEASSTRELNLVVKNSTKSSDYHLTPVMRELENIDQQIEDQLQAILPYLNFFFDSLLGETKPDDEDDDCVNNMVIELVPDETATQPNEKADKKSQPEDKSEPNPDTDNIERKSEDKSNDKPVSNSDVASTPEGPVDNAQTNP